MRKASKVLLDIFAWEIFIFLLFLPGLLARFLFGFYFDTVAGSGSMKPTLRRGEFIVLKKVKFEEVKVGDIITFKLKGEEDSVIHRVIKIEEGIGFLTKGDANERPDPWIVKPENLEGKLVFHLPYLGYFLRRVFYSWPER